MGKIVNGKTLEIGAPNIFGLLDIAFRKWTLKFRCGNCNAEPTVQHDEAKNWHKCPVCRQVNILDKTSYFQL